MSQSEASAGAVTPVTRETVIEVDRVYRGKHPRLTSAGEVNDRVVTYAGHSGVEFASPMDGGRCMYATHAEFRDWAGHDVTALYEDRDFWHGAADLQAWHEQRNYEQAA